MAASVGTALPVGVPVAEVVGTGTSDLARDGGKGTLAGEPTVSPLRSPGGSRRNYYAVYCGNVPGVYRHWSVASLQVNGVKGNSHKGFDTLEEAVESMRSAGFKVRDDGVVEQDPPGK
jgi:hypothetical protein